MHTLTLNTSITLSIIKHHILSITETFTHSLHLSSQKARWMTDVQRENVAHMLASMHLVLRQQDGGEKTPGEYGHVNNASYEKFIERFISLAGTL